MSPPPIGVGVQVGQEVQCVGSTADQQLLPEELILHSDLLDH